MGQLMDAASKDALTGCLSRGAFQELLEHEAKRARRHHSSFSLVVADVDDLKALNDSCAHHSGERTASAGRRLMRGGPGNRSGATSLGGDEFAMLLPDTDEDAVLVAATRLSEALEAVTGSDSVTARLGVRTWLGAHEGPDPLLRGADEALYVAKRVGGNRAAIWEPSLPEAQTRLQRLGRRPRQRRCEQPLPNSADCLERSQAGTVEVVDLLRPWGPRRAGAWCEWPAGAFRTSTRGAT